MPEHVLMSEIEIITDDGGLRRRTFAEKLRVATLVTARPTYGDRRITAILNRQLR